jgi:hypothetical protein
MGYRTMSCTDKQSLDAAGLTATAAKPVQGTPNKKITMTASTDGATPAFATCTKSTDNCKNSWDKVLRADVGKKITIDISCTDSAGFYGQGGANNVATAKLVGTITDTTPPTIYPKDIDHTEVDYKLNHKNDQGTYTVNGNKDGTHKSEKHQDNAKSFVPIAIDETLECDASVQEDTPLPWVTLSNNHLTDAKDTTGKNVKPLGHYFAQTVCRDDKFGAIKNAPDFTTDVTCQVHGGKNWQSCDDLSAYANKILTSSSACDGGKKCLQTTKRLFGEKCTDGSKNVQENKRKVIVEDTTPPTVDMKFKDWQAEWNTDAGRVGKPMAGKAHVRGGDGHTVHENHAIRVFKISADASHKGTFADACATGSKTTSGFNAARCENFIHDDTGARGEFYCKNIGKGWAKNRCTIATTEIGGMKLSDAAEMSFTDQCDNNDLFANPNFVEMSWKQVDSSGKVIACPAGASCNLDKNAKNVGIYHLQYEVRDKAGNKNAITFPIQMTDDEAPVIHMEGCSGDKCGEDMKECDCAVRLQASNTVEYTDFGAQCHDYVDGVLSHAVEVSGQVVNMRVPGTYIIQYDCADLSGNAAVSVKREVFVEDTIKPVMTLESGKSQGTDILFVEAGFPYADAGATMSDSLDGVCVTHNNQDSTDDNDVVCNDSAAYGETAISGDTVDVFNNFFEKSSCAAIKAAHPEVKNGRYVVSPNNWKLRQMVNCFFKEDLALTFRIAHAATAPYCNTQIGKGAKLLGDAINAGDISQKTAQQALYKTTEYNRKQVDAIIRASTRANTAGDTLFACAQFGTPVTKHEAGYNTNSANSRAHSKGAEAGVYKIIYGGSDVAGNDADKIYRTVIVKDTLPPVISLGTPVSEEMNMKYMAETTSVNGWFIGAVACAVSGVALLATSMKKTTTAVPV